MMRKTQHLNMFGLAMLNVAAVMSLRGLPLMAEAGVSMLFYLLFASLLFLVPVSLISAELATRCAGEGGVYYWVKEAFGGRWGFMAIWLQWVQNVIWYPTVLAFAAGAFAYLFLKPELANNAVYTCSFIFITYWVATFITFRGLKFTGHVTTIAVILGTIVPGLFIIGLGLLWFFTGEPLHFLDTPVRFFPDLSHFSNIAFLANIVLLFSGMEVGAVHVTDLNNPHKQYPQAIFLAMFLIVSIFTLGALAVAAVLPQSEISLTAGIMEAFRRMLYVYHISWLLPLIGLLVAFGALGGVLAWIVGPSKGLLATAKNGEIPPFLAHTNKQQIQTHLLLIQGGIVTVLASLYLIMDNVSTAFFLLSAMTITLYLVMYFLLFLAAIKLRFSEPDKPSAYKVPGGKLGLCLLAGIGLLAVSFAFVVGFIPPEQLHVGTPLLYFGIVVAGFLLFTGLPLIIHRCKKPEWLAHPNVKRN